MLLQGHDHFIDLAPEGSDFSDCAPPPVAAAEPDLSGVELVQNFLRAWTPSFFADAVGSFSFLSNYQAISQGVIDLRHLLFFGSLIGIALLINTLIVDLRKGV